jgi:hypothetical protein
MSSKFDDCPEFKHLDPVRKQELIEINESLDQLHPWSLFLYARAKMIKEGVERGEDFYQISNQLSCDPEQVRRIYDSRHGPGGEIVGRIITY